MAMAWKFRSASLAAATILAGGIGFATGAEVAGSNWAVMVWSDPLTVLVDTDSIEPREARVVAHVMWDYSEAQVPAAAVTVPYRSMIGLLVFDCATLRFGGAGSVSYSGNGGGGEPVGQYAIDPASAPLGASEPGTIGRELADFVCARARGAKVAAR